MEILCPYCKNKMLILSSVFDFETYTCSSCGKKYIVKNKKAFKQEDITITDEDMRQAAIKIFPDDKEKQDLYIQLLKQL